MAHKEVPEDIQRLLKEVVDHFDKEDVAIRERQIRTWRRLKLMWEGFHRTWYSEVAHDWRIWDETTSDDTDQSYYDKPVNVLRAYLESIIAALSVVVPPIKCFPDDADNTLDLATARAGDKIASLVYRHNDVTLLWLHALFIYMTEGMVACYSYPKSDYDYGTYDKKDYESTDEYHQYTTCPNCGYRMNDEVIPQGSSLPTPGQTIEPGLPVQDGMIPIPPEMGIPEEMGGINTPPIPNQLPPVPPEIQGMMDLQADKYEPDDSDVPIQDIVQNSPEAEKCPICMAKIIPEISQETLVVTRLVGVTKEPKSRVCLEAYGGLFIKIPNYARFQSDCPYLIYAYETHYANVIERYAHLHGKKGLTPEKIKASSGPRDPYEEWGRLNPQYQGEYPTNVVTVRNAWLRPCSFNVLPNMEDVKRLKKLYPNGAKVVMVNDCFAEACNESLDDCWTITYNPLSDYLHADPTALLLVSIQEITNDLISLIIQTIEHGIGQTFVDPAVVNLNAYRTMESVPGGIYEAIPKSGQAMSQAFHEIKTATLSPEVMPFVQNIQSLGQLVSGALPSLFGGQLEGSETASEYSMSRAQALQRQQNTWKIFTVWWKQIFGKVIPMFIKETHDDERDVQRDKNGGFINVFIRRAELEGKIGKVELEANENLPLTWTQRKDMVMQLLQAGNPQILEIIGSSENLPIIREALGLTDFDVPGEDSREKQLDEIKLLLNSTPMPTGDPMMPEMSSVEVDPIFDEHPIEFETVRKWAISEAGRLAKMDNSEGYRNVLLHGMQHHQLMQQQMMMQQPQGEGQELTEQERSPEAPITEESGVETVQ